jgi:hypothetical protein
MHKDIAHHVVGGARKASLDVNCWPSVQFVFFNFWIFVIFVIFV